MLKIIDEGLYDILLETKLDRGRNEGFFASLVYFSLGWTPTISTTSEAVFVFR
jgi:hypothetical protein